LSEGVRFAEVGVAGVRGWNCRSIPAIGEERVEAVEIADARVRKPVWRQAAVRVFGALGEAESKILGRVNQVFAGVQPQRIDGIDRITDRIRIRGLRFVDEWVDAQELAGGGVVVAPYEDGVA
jgi:hypothetical protein